MEKKYTFDTDFNERIEDLWQTALCRYLNDDQYEYFNEEEKKLRKEFNDIMHEIIYKASSNTIRCKEAELKRYVEDYKLKTLSDLDKVIETSYKYIDGPAGWATYCNELELKDFCVKYSEIAKKYLEIEDK